MQSALLDKIKKRIDKRDPGEFVLPDVYGKGWEALYPGDQTRMNRRFLELVRHGDFPQVRDTLRAGDRGQIFIKHPH
ncbi:hypothetical protein BFP70_15865 [Thioclava sp. SK-1]|uniref:hypothetical protein n=1 Tax=Thioclava sp. SK-1 TaxID=1889770 RepID=UPI000825102D|nr:hypothetical protein [Thioclava sp. SK-1]OCX60948.1 hypothetical protein BFP70_15865 [Thioclava sp. SK-1]